MKSKKVWLMCGTAGSGKSTWIKENILPNSIVISRDEIRKSQVGEDVENNKYFSKEEEVFNIFKKNIQDSLNGDYKNIYIDATHINQRSRMKVLNNLKFPEDTELNVVWINVPLSEALNRNEKREGFELVPKSAILRMESQFEEPTEEEFGRYHFSKINIIEIKE